MKYLSLVVATAMTSAAPVWADEPAMQLAQKSNCMACHSLDAKVVGPAWKDVARKYAGDASAEAKLIAKVKKGGAGVWGQVPMPPNVTVKDADIRTIVQHLLSLK